MPDISWMAWTWPTVAFLLTLLAVVLMAATPLVGTIGGVIGSLLLIGATVVLAFVVNVDAFLLIVGFITLPAVLAFLTRQFNGLSARLRDKQGNAFEGSPENLETDILADRGERRA